MSNEFKPRPKEVILNDIKIVKNRIINGKQMLVK